MHGLMNGSVARASNNQALNTSRNQRPHRTGTLQRTRLHNLHPGQRFGCQQTLDILR